MCGPLVERTEHSYGPLFKRIRLETADRLADDRYKTLDGAARIMGISESALKQIESGKRRPSLETLEDMARAYNVMVGDLLPSSAPSGPEVAKIIGPLATLPPATRGRFVTQMAAFAAILSSEMNAVRETARLKMEESVTDTRTSMYREANPTPEPDEIVAYGTLPPSGSRAESLNATRTPERSGSKGKVRS